MSSKKASTPDNHEDILVDDGLGDAPAATKPKVNYGKEFLHCAGNNDKKRVVEIIEMGKRSGDDYINYQSKIGNSGLHQAAVMGSHVSSKAMTILLLDMGAELELSNKYGITPLMAAARNGNRLTCEALVEAGADWEAVDKSGSRPVDLASSKDAKAYLQGLHDEKAARLRAIRVKEVSATLMKAIVDKDFENVKKILKENTDIPEIMDFESEEPEHNDNSALFAGLDTGQPEVVHHLLESGANPNVKHKRDEQSPLIRVCSQKKLPSFPTTKRSRDIEDIRHNLTKALLGADADVNISDKDKNTALMAALENGHNNDIDAILDASVDETAANDLDIYGNSPIIIAARKQDLEAVTSLAAKRARLNHQGKEGMTALMWAAYHGNMKIAKVIMDNQCDKNLKSTCGRTAVMFATERKHIAMVEYLLARKADGNISHYANGSTPLIVASRMNQMHVVDKLIAGGCRVNETNDAGMTPLMWACWAGDKEGADHDVIEHLMGNGALPQIKTGMGKSAGDFTRNEKTKKFIEANTFRL
mmetsp:Transcript_7122/g.13544  ORF Transcript_7122/g.13544 Transcript_7122/m.13544 type:complete len:533 (-) Transcript_7122:82-1680(-)